jgi:Ner family transcriptional regulator
MGNRGWHRQDIIAEVRKTGVTLARLARSNKIAKNTMYMALDRRFPRVHEVIARQIGRSKGDIWPRWYSKEGVPRFNMRMKRGTA